MRDVLTKYWRTRQAIKQGLAAGDLKLNIGCGGNRQEGYINVDIRRLPNVDLVASPQQCLRRFARQCSEVYISHVLEHQENPGKVKRRHQGSVLGFLDMMNGLLRPGGQLRVAVPHFEAIVRLYVDGRFPLAPRLLGRLCGEQNYPENLHKCMFDRPYLEECLTECGFINIRSWNPVEEGFGRDSSFDELDGVATSLNLIAEKA